LHLGPRCTDDTRDTGASSAVWCVLQEKTLSTPGAGSKAAINRRLAKAMGTLGTSERGALPGATVGEDDRVVFVSAEPSCAAFTHLGPFPGGLLEQEETSLSWARS